MSDKHIIWVSRDILKNSIEGHIQRRYAESEFDGYASLPEGV